MSARQRLFERLSWHATAAPDSSAIECGGSVLTYRELLRVLEERVDSVPHTAARDFSVVERARSVELVFDLLTALVAGQVYVPIDPAQPARGRDMMRARLAGRVADPDAAYVFFTSGSGGPVPVLGSMSGLLAFIDWQASSFTVGPGDRVAFLSDVGHDLSLSDVLLPLWAGATLVIPTGLEAGSLRSTVDWLAGARITTVQVTASTARHWLWHGRTQCPEVRTVFFAGEQLPAGLLPRWKVLFPGTEQRAALYGPPETTLAKFVLRLPGDDLLLPSPVPVGRPLPGSKVVLIDPAEPLTAAAVARRRSGGEIVIVTPDASLGYLGLPARTAERFRPLPGGLTAFRTGELGQVTDGGDLVVTGRLDDEVTVNGVRVHPAEVTAAVVAQLRPQSAYVRAWPGRGDQRLVAYVVPSQGGRLDEAMLRRELLHVLPPALVPARVVTLDALPTLPDGTIDGQALPDPGDGGSSAGRFEPADGTVEEWLAAQFADLLDVPRVGAYDDFFALGGDTLVAAALMDRVEDRFDVRLAPVVAFDQPVVRDLAKEIEALRPVEIPVPAPAPSPGPDPEPPLVALDRTSGRLPMSAAQRRMYQQQATAHEGPAANLAVVARIAGPLSLDRVTEAVAVVVARHEVLRTICVDPPDGAPYLRPYDGAIPIDRLDWSTAAPEPGTDRLAAVGAELAAVAERPFRLDAEPPLRVVAARLGHDDHVLVFLAHQIALDSWSAQVLLDDFADAYAGRRDVPLQFQYADVAAWQRSRSTTDALGYWRDRLAGLAPVLDLPLDRPRPAVRSDAGAEVSFGLDPDLTRRLKAAADDLAVLPDLLLLAAFGYVLRQHCGTRDVAIGAPAPNRPRPEAERLIGCFVNTVVLRLDLTGGGTVRDLVGGVREAVAGATEHQELPLSRLVAELAGDRDPAVTPLVQTMFEVSVAGPPSPIEPGLTMARAWLPRRRAESDLTCAFVDHGERYEGSLNYATAVLTPATAARLADHLEDVLRVMLADLDGAVRDLPSLPRQDLAVVAPGPVRTAGLEPEPFVAAFERQAATHPNRIALRSGSDAITYAKLNGSANRLAHHLIERRVGRGTSVALLFQRGADHVLAMLAVQKAGARAVPLDPSFPAEHLVRLVSQSGAAMLLTHRAAGAAELGTVSAETVVLEDTDTSAAPGTDPERRWDPADPMHTVFTVGSTGPPKGVVISHRAYAHYLASLRTRLGWPDGMSFAATSSPADDRGLTTVHGALATGGTLHVLPERVVADLDLLARYFRAEQIDVVACAPSQLRAMSEAGVLADVMPARSLVLADEPCPWDVVEPARAARPDCAVWSVHGPIETTGAVLAYEVPPRRPDGVGPFVPLGRPLDHARAYLVDADLRLVPLGVPGELLIGGPSVARECVGEPPVDAARFVLDPYGSGGPAYRSGVRARFRPDGTIEFLGRLDRQVTRRGHRVEPAAVETALRAVPGVAAVAVAVRPGLDGRDGRDARDARDTLVAYYVPMAAPLPVSTLNSALRAAVPEYLVPDGYVALDRLPVTADGTLDVHALPDLDREAGRSATRTPPRNARDARLAAIWSEELGVEDVGIDEDFYDLGGDPVTALRVVRRIGGGLRVAALTRTPTVRGLADRLAGGLDAGRGMLRRLTAAIGDPAVTVVSISSDGGAESYRRLARTMPPDYAFYTVALPGHDPAKRLVRLREIDRITVECATEVRAKIDGPVLVYGHGAGAALAVSLAEELDRTGADLVGIVAGGAYPTPRPSGRLPDLWGRVLSTDKLTSDRAYLESLRAAGSLPASSDPGLEVFLLRALRHDARQAEDYYTRRCDAQRNHRLHALTVVGAEDPQAKAHQEHYTNWNWICADAEIAVIPGAGPHFPIHQAPELGAILVDWSSRRLAAPADGGTSTAPGGPSLSRYAQAISGQVVSLTGNRLTDLRSRVQRN